MKKRLGKPKPKPQPKQKISTNRIISMIYYFENSESCQIVSKDPNMIEVADIVGTKEIEYPHGRRFPGKVIKSTGKETGFCFIDAREANNDTKQG